MRKCKICEKGNVEGDYYICNYCGWESDPLQEENQNYIGGANEMSFNQYKKFFKDCKNELLAANSSLDAIKLSIEYYKKNFQNQNEEILRKEEAGEITQKIKCDKAMKENIKNIEENRVPPYKCKICGMGDIKNSYDICLYCGW